MNLSNLQRLLTNSRHSPDDLVHFFQNFPKIFTSKHVKSWNERELESVIGSSLGNGHEYAACVKAFVKSHISLHQNKLTASVESLVEALELCGKGPYKTYTVEVSDNYHVDIVTAIVKTASKIRSKFQYGMLKIENKKNLEKINMTLHKLIRFTNTCKKQGAKKTWKRALLPLLIEILKVQIAQNNITGANELVGQLEVRIKQSWVLYNMADKVAYYYLMGRFCILQEKFTQAEKYLLDAFRNCHIDSARNRRRVMYYLIPVKIYYGKFPTIQLLDEFNIMGYSDLVLACQTGNMNLYLMHFKMYEHEYIAKGLYFLIERLELLVQAKLVQNMHVTQKKLSLQPDKNHIIFFNPLYAVMKIAGVVEAGEEDEEDDQKDKRIISILSCLVYEGYLGGYLSHKSRALVLAKAATIAFKYPKKT